jgi:hypothetical protein
VGVLFYVPTVLTMAYATSPYWGGDANPV